MKEKINKVLIIIGIVFLILVVVGLVTSYVDSARVRNGVEPKHVIKVVDENLIGKTGGIVQGMSGSPIIQEGKIIGAITHVFLNDPTGGYGIFAETMLDVADGLAGGVGELDKAS